MKETHYIYRITHLPSGRFYIGKRSCNGPWQEDPYMGSGTYLRRLLKKYPAEEFKKEVLCLCRDAAQALYAERAAIGTQWRDDPLCINLTDGGGGVVGYFDLPENREAHSERAKKRFEDPAQREALSEAQKKRFEDPAVREAASEKAKKRFEDPSARQVASEAAKKRFEDPAQLAALSEQAKRQHADPEFRKRFKAMCNTPEARDTRRRNTAEAWKDDGYRATVIAALQSEKAAEARREARERPEVRARASEVRRNKEVSLLKDNVVYSVQVDQLISELSAGAVFTATTISVHNPDEAVWLTAASPTAKDLLLLDAGWEFGKRRVLEQITIKHVDKTTGKVLPRS